MTLSKLELQEGGLISGGMSAALVTEPLECFINLELRSSGSKSVSVPERVDSRQCQT